MTQLTTKHIFVFYKIKDEIWPAFSFLVKTKKHLLKRQLFILWGIISEPFVQKTAIENKNEVKCKAPKAASVWRSEPLAGGLKSASIAKHEQNKIEWLKMAIEKCMTERFFMVEHDNARSEGTRKGWVGNENERCYAIAFFWTSVFEYFFLRLHSKGIC